jgi:hypothetical protein
MKQWWDSYLFQGSHSFILASKFMALKVDLKRWNETMFGNVERKKKVPFEDLCVLGTIKEGRALGVEESMKYIRRGWGVFSKSLRFDVGIVLILDSGTIFSEGINL